MGKKLNLFDLTSIGVGCIVGSGVFALMGMGIAQTGRGIVLALFLAMLLCVLQSLAFPLLTRIFELDGGEYDMNSLVCPKIFAGFAIGRDIIFRAGALAVTVIALTQYFQQLFPAIAPVNKLVSIILMTLAFLCVIVGDKFAAKVQNIMCIFMYAALALFVVYGFIKMDPQAYAGEPVFAKGGIGLVVAIALMSYTCNGFQYVVNMGKSASNPRRNIPLALCLSAFVGAAIYALIGFAATHSYSYSVIAGKNLGDIAGMMMPQSLYLFFIIGGAIFALGTSLVGGIIAGYRPLIAAAQDGWIPPVLAKTSKKGMPYVMILLYLIGVIPILTGMDLGDVATICLFPSAITKLVVSFYALSVPKKFAGEWKNSGTKMSVVLYKALLIIAMVAAIILGIFYFLSNDLKLAMIILTACIFVYSILMAKFGKVDIRIKDVYPANVNA